MARIARVVIPNIPHHVVQRGNRRQVVYFTDKDRSLYMSILSEHANKHNLSIWAYCLMDNHVHLIVVPRTETDLAKAIGDTHKAYTRSVNFREGWRGYLWQGRFSSHPMDNGYLFAAMRYVERNPVRAGMVTKAEYYQWSSARSHVMGIRDNLLSGDEIEVMQIGNWQAYLREPDDEKDLKAFRLETRTGRPLGNDDFIEKLEAVTGRLLKKQKTGPKKIIK